MAFSIKQPVYIGHNGGGTTYTGAEIYFYLVFDSENPKDQITEDVLKEFYRSGITASDQYVFVVLDLRFAEPLKRELPTTDEGKALLDNLVVQSPAFAISNRNLSDAANANNVEVISILNYENEVSVIFQKMHLPSPSARAKGIALLRRLNSYVELNIGVPGIFVIKLSRVISDLIDQLEGPKPPSPA